MKPRWKHQAETIAFMAPKSMGLDTSDPGTGKTRAHLEVFAARKGHKRMLVVCPKTLMRSAWGNDIEEFTPQLTCAYADAGRREEAFRQVTDIVIINTDGVKELRKNRKLLEGFTDLVIDEISYFKHRGSIRTKAMMWLARLFKRRYGMTGTPNPRSVTELWAPMYIIDGGKRLGTAYGMFRNITQHPVQTGPGIHHIKWEDAPGAQQAVADLIGDITIRHDFEEVMKDVPPNHKHRKRFKLAPKTRAIYDRLEDESVARLDGDQVVTAVHKAALRTKLLQVASGAVYTSPDKYTVIDRSRYELIGDLVEERDFSLVFFSWKHQRDELIKEMQTRGISFEVLDGNTPARKRDDIVKRYQAGELQTILMHPKTGAHGLTLTRGTTTIIASPFSEADIFKQTIHRIYRGGQTQITNTIMIQADDTIEGHVYEQLSSKYGRMLDLLELMKLRGKL